MFIDFREREEGREGEREKHTCDRETPSVASYMCPDQGLNPYPRYVPRLGINPAAFWCMGQCSNQLSHLAKAL